MMTARLMVKSDGPSFTSHGARRLFTAMAIPGLLFTARAPGRAQHIPAILSGRKLWMSSLPQSRPNGHVQGPMEQSKAHALAA